MSNLKKIKLGGRNLDISRRVLQKLIEIKKECEKNEMDTTFIIKLMFIAAYYRKSPEYVLMYLEPVLEMVKNKIVPSKAFALFEDFLNIDQNVKKDAKESIRKRMAQENRLVKIQQKRELFKKIRDEYKLQKEEKKGKSLKMLLEEYFPEVSEKGDKALENLRQQYYRTIRREVGVKKERIEREDVVINEFRNYYFLDQAGIAEQVDGEWHIRNLHLKYGISRSRIDRIMSRQKYEKKFVNSWIRRLKKKKRS